MLSPNVLVERRLHGLTGRCRRWRKKTLTIELKYFEGKPVIEEIKRCQAVLVCVSTVVLRTCPKVNGGLGIAIVSTVKV